MPRQHRDDGRAIRQSDLVRLDRFARGNELIAGRYDADNRRPADVDRREPGRRYDRDIQCRNALTGGQQLGTLYVIGPSRVNELPFLRLVACLDQGDAVHRGDAFDGDDAIGAIGKCRARHDLDALASLQRESRVTGRLCRLDREFADTLRIIGKCNRDAVHRHTIEWRLVAFGDDGLAQRATDRLVHRH